MTVSNIDLAKLEKDAKTAMGFNPEWFDVVTLECHYGIDTPAARLVSSASPAVILELLRRIAAAEQGKDHDQ